MVIKTSAPRVVITGRPSWRRLAVCIVGVTGAMVLALAAAFGVAMGSSPWMALFLTASMLVYWAPAACWASWWLSVPAVLTTGVVLAWLTHRHRLPNAPSPDQRRRARMWRHVGQASALATLACGAWSVLVGAIMLLSPVFT